MSRVKVKEFLNPKGICTNLKADWRNGFFLVRLIFQDDTTEVIHADWSSDKDYINIQRVVGKEVTHQFSMHKEDISFLHEIADYYNNKRPIIGKVNKTKPFCERFKLFANHYRYFK